MNYFDLFGIPETFVPDPKLVKKKYYELSRLYHPDFYSQATPEEQAEILEKSSQINQAYKILLDPDETIRYILMQKGLMEGEEKYQLSKEFLIEMMDLNEQFMEAGVAGDQDKLREIKIQISNLQKEIYEPVKEIIENTPESLFSEKGLLQVKEYYYQKKYLNRILAGEE